MYPKKTPARGALTRRHLIGGLAATTGLGLASRGNAAEPIPIRMMALGVGFPFLMTSGWKEGGFDKKFGFDLTVQESGNLTGQWNVLRAGDVDLVMGNVLDILRNHKAGVRAKAFHFGYNFGDPIVTNVDKPYRKLNDLKGASVGITRATVLPILLYRVAGKKAYNFDLVTETKIAEASPSLLPEMLRSGKLDATYSLQSLVFQDIAENRVREVASLPHVLTDAGWDLAMNMFVISDAWRAKHGDEAVKRLAQALRELNHMLRTTDVGWDAYASTSRVTERHKPAFKETFRKLLVPNFGAQNLKSAQEIIEAMIAAAGEPIVGVTKADPAAFDFKSFA
jgi:ABC-type nitrate/sulfonate/bicarbonate transport system substrate-binding protein